MAELIVDTTAGDCRDCILAYAPSLRLLEEDEKMAWMLAFGLLLAVATVGNSRVTWFIIGILLHTKNGWELLNIYDTIRIDWSSEKIGESA